MRKVPSSRAVYCDGCRKRWENAIRERIFVVCPEHLGFGLGVQEGEVYCAPCAREVGIR